MKRSRPASTTSGDLHRAPIESSKLELEDGEQPPLKQLRSSNSSHGEPSSSSNHIQMMLQMSSTSTSTCRELQAIHEEQPTTTTTTNVMMLETQKANLACFSCNDDNVHMLVSNSSTTSDRGTEGGDWTVLDKNSILHILSFLVLEPYMFKNLSCYGKFKQDDSSTITLLYTTIDLNILYQRPEEYFTSSSAISLYFTCTAISGARLILAKCCTNALLSMVSGSHPILTPEHLRGLTFKVKLYPTTLGQLRDCISQVLIPYANIHLTMVYSEFQKDFVAPKSLQDFDELKKVIPANYLNSSLNGRLRLYIFLKNQQVLEWFCESGVIPSLLSSPATYNPSVRAHVWLNSLPRHKHWPPPCPTHISLNLTDQTLDQFIPIMKSIQQDTSLYELSHVRYHHSSAMMNLNDDISSSSDNYLVKKQFFLTLIRLCHDYKISKLTTSVSGLLEAVNATTSSNNGSSSGSSGGSGGSSSTIVKNSIKEMRLKAESSDSESPSLESAAFYMCHLPVETMTLYTLDDTCHHEYQSIIKTMQILVSNSRKNNNNNNTNWCQVKHLRFKEYKTVHLQLFLTMLPSTVTVYFDFHFEEIQDAYDILTAMKLSQCQMKIRLYDVHMYDMLDDLFELKNVTYLEVFDYEQSIGSNTREYLNNWLIKKHQHHHNNHHSNKSRFENDKNMYNSIRSYRTKRHYLVHVIKDKTDQDVGVEEE